MKEKNDSSMAISLQNHWRLAFPSISCLISDWPRVGVVLIELHVRNMASGDLMDYSSPPGRLSEGLLQ